MKKLLIIILISISYFASTQDFKGLDKSPMDRVFYPVSNQGYGQGHCNHIQPSTIEREESGRCGTDL